MNSTQEDLVRICGEKRKGKTLSSKYVSKANSEASYENKKRHGKVTSKKNEYLK